jgi:hypothetical protein
MSNSPVREDIALGLGEPEFDMVQPRRIGRREVELHTWVGREKDQDLLRLCARYSNFARRLPPFKDSLDSGDPPRHFLTRSGRHILPSIIDSRW